MPDETRALTEAERTILARISGQERGVTMPRMWRTTCARLRERGLVGFRATAGYEHEITDAGRRALARATGEG